MANCGKDIVLEREGTEQFQRFIDALDQGAVKLNDFGLKEWMQFAYRFAKHVNYFDILNPNEASGNWEDFFIDEGQLNDFLAQEANSESVTPHLALFVSFVNLLGYSKERFNRLTARHLDFYYREVLRIGKLPASADKVHLIFELARQRIDAKIEKGTEFDAGKDKTGQKLIYKAVDEFIANTAKVVQLKSLYNDHRNSKLKIANDAGSFDGKGASFPENDVNWWPFGYYQEDGSNLKKEQTYPELSDAKVGFAIASDILKLIEGERNICIAIEFASNLPLFSSSIFTENIEIFCSGEKGWLGPFSPESEIRDKDKKLIYTTSAEKNILKLAFTVPIEEKSVVSYQADVSGENFNTDLPVCRVLIKTENTEGYDLYRSLIGQVIEKLTVDVNVRGIKSLELENDTGKINAAKPFYPFGTQPVKRSNFIIGYPELFNKKWNDIRIVIDWKNTPDSFVDLYYAYRKNYLTKTSSSGFIQGMFLLNELETNIPGNVVFAAKQNISGIDPTPKNLIVNGNNHFKARVEVLHKEIWEKDSDLVLFVADDEGFMADFSIKNKNYETGKNGPVRMSLNQSFLHELFARIYALAFSSGQQDALIPNEPYTPMIESISLSYSATASMNMGKEESDFQKNNVKLYHEHPFGQSEEHPYLKHQLSFLAPSDKNTFLLPAYCKGGELYIGLENTLPLQQVSLLVQVLEGSENPLAETFTGKQKVEWSVMVRNQWRPLESDEMLKNETRNFLKSGLVQFVIPQDAGNDNTRLPSGLIWIKAQMYKNYDAVCQAIAIYAQATLATFSDQQNELSHLENGLKAGSITKMAQRVASIKSVNQPFASFGGKAVESDQAYYRRVSERLRHKNRAISIWDYEHLILQNFPEIHKVKCLNHTSASSFLAPGHLYLVVIPDIVNKNVFDLFQPRVSQSLLNDIKSFVDSLSSLHVNTIVANPDYEEVSVSLKVKFRVGFDENYYQKVLNDDIVRFLSPWAFRETATLRFGQNLHLSILIHYLEKLNYIDYLQDVKLRKDNGPSQVVVSPGSPKAILVSAKQHDIGTAESPCSKITEIEESCQM